MSYLRDALRQLVHRPALSFTIVLTLALGMGANAAVFSVVRGVLLRPLPFAGPRQLVAVWETQPGNDNRGAAPANFLEWRAAGNFEGLAAYSRKRRVLSGEQPERITLATVSSNFFDLLGVRPVSGRTFRSVVTPGDTREVVFREDFWRRRFSADSSLVGRTIRLDDETLRVVGIVSAGLAFPEDAVAWTQAPYDVPELGSGAPTDLRRMRDAWYFRVVGRLKQGVTLQQAQAEMDAIAARLASEYPSSNRDAGVRLESLQDQMTGSTAPILWILTGIVACVLGVACANVATLLLAGAAGRTRELTIRVALGASRGRLLRQLSAESLLLSIAGAILGLGAAWVARPALIALLPASTPRTGSIQVDVPVALFTLGLSVATALAFGTAPAMIATRAGNFTSLRDGGRSGPSKRGARMASLLVAGQIAVALVLVTGTGLMLRTLWTLYQRDIGIDIDRLLTLDVTLPDARTRGRAAAALEFTQMVERLAVVPGVTSAAAIQSLPLSGVGASASLRVDGRAFAPNEAPDVAWRAITPGYFDTVGARLLRGRAFTAIDREGAPAVAVINDTLARLVWPDRDPIGARIGTGLDGNGVLVTVVGVVADVPQESLHARVQPEMYRPLAQPSRFSSDAMSLVMRTDTDPSRLASAAREAIRRAHPHAPVGAVRTMGTVAAAGVATEVMAMRALAIFGGLALVLAAVGLYGAMARLVADRQRELGVRLALGAAPRHVRWLVLGRTFKIAFAGCIVGAVASLVLSRQLAALLHGVSGADPVVLALSSAVLLGVALAAGYLPARRASKIDPLLAMRTE